MCESRDAADNNIPRMKVERESEDKVVPFHRIPNRGLFYCFGYTNLYLRVSDQGKPRAVRMDTGQVVSIADQSASCRPVEGTLTVR